MSVQHPNKPFDADNYVGNLEHVLDLATAIHNGRIDTEYTRQNLADAIEDVQEPSNRDGLRFHAFTFDERYAIRQALRSGYRQLRIRMLRFPDTARYHECEARHFETALRAFGMESAIMGERGIARNVVADMQAQGYWGGAQSAEQEG